MKYLVILLVSYTTENNQLEVSRVKFFPIEFLDWNCLNIGALGWGQIQISNLKNIIFTKHKQREIWLKEFKIRLKSFYDKELDKIAKRKKYFFE